MHTHIKSCLGLVAVALAACSTGGADDGPVGSATVAIAIAPADVSCVRITVTGTRTEVRSFDVVPGFMTTFTLSNLPIGPDTFSADAFSTPCSGVVAGAVPTWVSDPVSATIATGTTTPVTIQLRHNGIGNVTIDFASDGTGGTTTTPAIVSAGFHHTCALVNQTVKCWGANESGQLGDGTTSPIGGPVTVPLGGMGVFPTDVSVGQNHSCALLSDGTVWCWGRNTFSQVGTSPTVASPTPVMVNAGAPVTAIAAGGDHTCAIRSLSDIVCWGRGDSGELGNGGNAVASGVVVVAAFNNAIAITAGIQHTCGLRGNGGGMQCWGTDGSGQLGNGPAQGDSNVPNDVPEAARAVAIDAGGPFTCAIVPVSGVPSVLCWGGNFDGELGFADMNGSESPTSGPTLPGTPVAITAGGLHGCALVADPTMVSGRLAYCWGAGGDGELGNGASVSGATPVKVSGIGGSISSLSAGGYHTCAGFANGTVQCWGGNDFGQLGDHTTTPRSVPGAVVF